MKFAAVASLAFAGAVAAQNSTASANSNTDCATVYNTCRSSTVGGLPANQAQCSSDHDSCISACYTTYSSCQTTPVGGLPANQAECTSDYSTCLGESAVGPDGTVTVLPASASSSATSTSSAASASSTAACQSSYDSCRSAPDANMASCASDYASCLGTNPFASNGTNTVTPLPSMVYTTEVVTAVTTVCPAATSGAYTTTIGKNIYTVSSATTITVTDCPCTVSSMVPAKSAMTSVVASSGAGNKNGTATASKPAVYTGAAAQFGAGFGLLGAAAGAVMLL